MPSLVILIVKLIDENIISAVNVVGNTKNYYKIDLTKTKV